MGLNTATYAAPVPAASPSGIQIASAITAHYHKEGYTNLLPLDSTSLIKATAILIVWN